MMRGGEEVLEFGECTKSTSLSKAHYSSCRYKTNYKIPPSVCTNGGLGCDT